MYNNSKIGVWYSSMHYFSSLFLPSVNCCDQLMVNFPLVRRIGDSIEKFDVRSQFIRIIRLSQIVWRVFGAELLMKLSLVLTSEVSHSGSQKNRSTSWHFPLLQVILDQQCGHWACCKRWLFVDIGDSFTHKRPVGNCSVTSFPTHPMSMLDATFPFNEDLTTTLLTTIVIGALGFIICKQFLTLPPWTGKQDVPFLYGWPIIGSYEFFTKRFTFIDNGHKVFGSAFQFSVFNVRCQLRSWSFTLHLCLYQRRITSVSGEQARLAFLHTNELKFKPAYNALLPSVSYVFRHGDLVTA